MKKRMAQFLAFFAVFTALSAPAAEIELSSSASTFVLDDEGDVHPYSPGYGFSLAVRDRILENLDGSIAFDRDPVNGNMLTARVSFLTSFLAISAGPSLGVLNSAEAGDDVSYLFQPGIGLGFSIIVPGIGVAKADTDFAIPTASSIEGQLFLQRGELSIGFYLPNVLTTVKISQRSNIQALSGGFTATRSVMDYGLYNEAFMKGSPFRISLDFIYRVIDYYVTEDSPENLQYGNLVLGGGVTWVPKADISFYVAGSGSLYTFSLDDSKDDIDKFLFDVKLGARLMMGKN